MITILDYKAGNLTSVKRALDYLGIAARISPDPRDLETAERIIFPGVGHAAAAMETLTATGLDRSLKNAFKRGVPLLGICLGSQIVLSRSEEGPTGCLGLMEGTCPRFALSDPALKIPHMGWDNVEIRRPHPLLAGCEVNDEFYFVHSFYPLPAREEEIYAVCEYETVFPAAIGRSTLFATQFHPEKSGEPGLEILKRFSRWDGSSC